ncbi:MAG TPA: sugar ABC transporter permease [Candidatus Limiplasma sp.]|nr:sugar ABC transporter permease [Candidatus Limiplasma sp.]
MEIKGMSYTANLRRQTRSRLKRYKTIYLLMIPVVAYFLVFSYFPMALGVFNSLHEIKLLGSITWVGLDQYRAVLSSPVYGQATVNTLIVGMGTFLLQLAWGLLLALCITELRRRVSRSFFQTATYIPYLLSWAVVGSIWIAILSPSGMINGFLRMIFGDGFRRIVFMSERSYARAIMIFTGAWKTAGYTAALFLAAIISINPSLYEAAAIDGATRVEQIRRITLPSIIPTVKVVTLLAVMGMLRNFDQIYIMSNASILDKVRNLLYLIYMDGIVQFKVGLASAAACLVLAMTLLLTLIVRKLIGYDRLG